jgi:DNA primase
LRELGRIVRWEHGKDPDEPQSFETDDYLKQIMAGKLDPLEHIKAKQEYIRNKVKKFTPEQLAQVKKETEEEFKTVKVTANAGKIRSQHGIAAYKSPGMPGTGKVGRAI